MVEARISNLERTMVEVSTDIKHIKSMMGEIKDSLKKFESTHDDVLILKERVKNLEHDVSSRPNMRSTGTIATAAGIGAVSAVELVKTFLF